MKPILFNTDMVQAILQNRKTVTRRIAFPNGDLQECMIRDNQGNEYGKTKQVARCGNAVCPPMAEAVVRANVPEWCGGQDQDHGGTGRNRCGMTAREPCTGSH